MTPTATTVLDLTRPAPLPSGLMIDIAAGLAGVPALWRPHAVHGPEHHAVRLLATESYEAWVICWSDDAIVDLHDHGDAAGALVVVEGELAEVVASGRRRVLGRGSVAHLPVGVPHDVVATTAEPTTSIHVYSPPLETMGRYDEAGIRLAADPVVVVPAVHDAPSYVRALDAAERSAVRG
ncbi:MAG TPA: cupin domain-containing protein [Iamia sp.]|nr:cupin domain-containing protein [Iamia sp.]